MGPAEIACELFARAVERSDPAERVAQALGEVELEGDVVLLAVGKAAARMAAGAASALGDRIVGGVVVAPEPDDVPAGTELLVGSHPVPDAASEHAGRALLEAARRASPDQRVVALISGGASALAAVPAPGLELADKRAAVAAVMAFGAPITEINVVRKHLSAIKGGRLAAVCRAPVLSLVSSDVVGDDLASIGSGPTVADPSTNARALAILEHTKAPIAARVRRHLERGEDSPKRLDPMHSALLVAGTGALVASAVASHPGAQELRRDVVEDVVEVARWLAAQARRAAADAARDGRQIVRVAGGEPTIRLPPEPGRGGRAQQVALLVAREIAGVERVAVLCAGSDGVDGNTAAAGAVVDGATWGAAGGDPAAALARCDAHPALAAADALLVTGRTGVNHADLFVVVAAPC